MENEKRLIPLHKRIVYGGDVFNALLTEKGWSATEAAEFIQGFRTADAVEVPDKELLKAIKLLITQYAHSKASDYVHSPVAHALFHTWKQVDERR